MSEVIKNSWEWCKTHISLKDIAIIVLLIFVIFSISRCSSYKKKSSESQYIINALDDSLYTYKAKNGELYNLKKTYITDIKSLKTINEDLYNQVKNLKDNPIVVTKVDYKYIVDSIVMGDTITKYEDKYYTSWNHRDKYMKLYGKSVFNMSTLKSTTTMDSLEIDMDMNVDLIEKDGQLSIIANSDNPYVVISDINGAVISPEKSKALSNHFAKKNHIGISAGVGVIGGYGFGNSGPTPFIGVGGMVGVTYTRSLFGW